jgi:hypothetical protein
LSGTRSKGHTEAKQDIEEHDMSVLKDNGIEGINTKLFVCNLKILFILFILLFLLA